MTGGGKPLRAEGESAIEDMECIVGAQHATHHAQRKDVFEPVVESQEDQVLLSSQNSRHHCSG